MLDLDNIIIDRIIAAYLDGQIITKEEMLCRMFIELSENWELKAKQAWHTYEQITRMPLTGEDQEKREKSRSTKED